MVQKYTIKDIARLAGVGVGTVSRVINNEPGVKQSTSIKVLKIIEECGYIPNSIARSLKQNSSKLIGIIIKGNSNPFFNEIIEAIKSVAMKKKFGILLHYTNSSIYDTDSNLNKDDYNFQYLLDRKVEGIIYLGGFFNKELSEYVKKIRIPLVVANTILLNNINRNSFSSVTIDNKKSAFDLVDYLCKKGHKRIALIGSNEIDYTYLERLSGYKEALSKNNIEYDKNIMEYGDYEFKGAYEACKKILKKEPKVSAIFAISDIMAIGAARAILEEGYKIPEDISLAGFDGLENTDYFYPSITTMEQPKYNLGLESAELLFDRIKNNEPETVHKILDTILLEKESVIAKK